MKKLLFILCIFTCTAGFGQTKEETIAWINTYASDLLRTENINVTEDGEITIEEFSSRGKANNKSFGKNVFHLKDVLLTDYTTHVKGNDNDYTFLIKTNGKKITFIGHDGAVHHNNSDKAGIDSPVKENVERVAKAVMHLAKLFGAKEKPKESTF